MKKLLIPLFIFLISFSVFAKAKAGGATSGGGDILGIDAAKVTDHVFSSINIIGSKLYTEDDLEVIRKIKSELKIIMIDNDLPVVINDVVQNGSAYSVRDEQSSTMFILKRDWNKIGTLLEREILIHHEIMVLAGLEFTGDYHLSLEFKKLRETFWRLAENKKVICSISTYEKSDYYGEPIPGKLIGSSSASINFVGYSGGMGVLAKLKNGNALIWRGVIGSGGYFRMQIEEAEYYKVGFFEKKKDWADNMSINLGATIEKEAMRTYSDPYQIEKPMADPMVFGNNYAIVVNCNQF